VLPCTVLQIDFIRVYPVEANTAMGSPAHWQYMTLGFSDLHGDGRLYPAATGTTMCAVHSNRCTVEPSMFLCTEAQPRSGFGFELCFRLRRQPWETAPPSWPCELFNTLALFVNLGCAAAEAMVLGADVLCGRFMCDVGPLGCSDAVQEALKPYLPTTPHALLIKESTLEIVDSPTGTVEFMQVCALSDDEHRAAMDGSIDTLCGAYHGVTPTRHA